MAQQRYEGLDHLRGLLTITVMGYHFSHWLGLEVKLPFLIQRPLNLLGLYAVSAFYCLSGAALFIVYRSRKMNFTLLREFAIKRSFRICPLFWAATTASLALGGFAALKTEPIQVMLSYTLLYSWIEPTAYFATGAWAYASLAVERGEKNAPAIVEQIAKKMSADELAAGKKALVE